MDSDKEDKGYVNECEQLLLPMETIKTTTKQVELIRKMKLQNLLKLQKLRKVQ